MAVAQDAVPAGVIERQVTFPTDGLQAPGTLAQPTQPKTKLAIVVMVQGSGVQDRDETIGPNKVFQQIAWELAKRGIASLRYDRRAEFDLASFKAHPDLDHEVVIDAVSALAYAATLPEVDATKVFYLGHSLGAQLGPDVVAAREAEKPGSVHGMLLLSGIARPINVVVLEQIKTMGKLQGGTPEQLATVAAPYEKLFAMVKDPNVPDSTPTGRGTTLGYWRDWMKRDPLATMAKLKVPALVLRGTNDMNSSHEDFELLCRAAPPGSACREFAGLNHEYVEGSGSGAEAMKPNHVAAIVMDAIATWIKTGKLE
jgi:hypothetical protein